MTYSFLNSFGLTDKESALYELLIQNGEMPVSRLISLSNLKRATVYKSLYALEEKHLVIIHDVKKILHVKPEEPAKLLEFAENHMQEIQRAREDLRTFLPDMVSQFLLSVEKPVVTTFEGVKGLKQIYLDTLNEKKPIYAMLTTSAVEPELFEWLTSYYGKQRKKLGITANVIVASGSWAEEYREKDAQELRTTVMVPNDTFPFQHEVDIYGSKVAFINYKKGDKLVGIIINHPQIARTMKAIFDLAWIGAKTTKKATSSPPSKPVNA